MPKLLLSFGDRSADNILSRILPLFKTRGVEIYGTVGERTNKFVNPLGEISDIEATGLVEAIPKIPKALKLERKLLEFAKREKPEVALLVDAPGFNLRLLKKLKAAGVKKVAYFILPQFWAWKEERKRVLEENANLLLSILPFEGRYFENSKVNFRFVGHPSVEILKEALKNKKPPSAGKYFVVFPGSRPSEIKRHIPVLERAVPLAEREFGIKPVVLTFRRFEHLLGSLTSNSEVVFLDKNPSIGYLYLKGALFGWIKSGTTAFETALLGTPHLIFYRVSFLTYWVAKLLVKTPYLHLANITLGEEVVPELLQGEFSVKNLLRTTEKLLTRREEMEEKLSELGERMKNPEGKSVFETVAEEVLRLFSL